MRRFWPLIAALPVPASALAQDAGPVVIASPPRATSVTLYRSPDGGGGNADDADTTPQSLDGYALIGEQRDIDLPAGPAVVRFPGVAAGMLAESVVVSGLPDGVREKNLDAQLLSPSHLYAGSFGRPVTLRRTSPDGKIREERAIIRSAPDGAGIVETSHGFEVIGCGPGNAALGYPELPPDLFATPTLSIATDAPAPVHVSLRLTYLAWDYDWRADYVLKLASNGQHGELSAWITLASADDTSFPGATAAVVAGKANFDETRRNDSDAGVLVFRCLPVAPMANEMRYQALDAVQKYAPAPPPPPPSAEPMSIIVTARKVVVAEAENLGDLKLYRLPQPTTVAAHSRKQVALLEPRTIAITLVHTTSLDDLAEDEPAHLMVRSRNQTSQGLGLALPAGRVRVLMDHDDTAALVGQGSIGNRAINDRVDITTASTPNVVVSQTVTHKARHWQAITATVTNANAFDVTYLGTFKTTPIAAIHNPSAKLELEDGHYVWTVRVPANGRAILRYRHDTD